MLICVPHRTNPCSAQVWITQILPCKYTIPATLSQRSQILCYLLTGHNHLNRHLTLMQRTTDSLCPLCKEDDETSYTFFATIRRRNQYFGAPFLEPKDLRQVHWITLLRFAKTSTLRDFNNLLVKMGKRIGPKMWPQRWVA